MSSVAVLEQTPECTVPLCLSWLARELANKNRVDAAIAAALLEEVSVDPSDLLPWTDFHHPVRDGYGRQLVTRGPNYELMVMSWAPGDYSAIHDHGAAEWGAVLYLGRADHIVFEMQQGTLCPEKRMQTEPNSVCAVDSSLIHLMGNPTDAPFLSLHLYGRETPAEAITSNARIFDLWEKHIQRTDGGVFFCLPESEVVSREECLPADRAARLLHHQLMLDRIERIRSAGGPDLAFQQRAFALRQEINALESGGRRSNAA